MEDWELLRDWLLDERQYHMALADEYVVSDPAASARSVQLVRAISKVLEALK